VENIYILGENEEVFERSMKDDEDVLTCKFERCSLVTFLVFVIIFSMLFWCYFDAILILF